MELAYIGSNGRQIIGRDISQKDYYKVIDWQNKVYYLICHGSRSGKYDWVCSYDWGKVSNYFISTDNPLEFIFNRVRALNNQTSTGVKLIKQLKRLPFNLERFN